VFISSVKGAPSTHLQITNNDCLLSTQASEVQTINSHRAVLLENLTVAQPRKPPNFKESDAGPCSERNEPNYHPRDSVNIHLNAILPSTPTSSKWPLPSNSPVETVCCPNHSSSLTVSYTQCRTTQCKLHAVPHNSV
jgi:hypothetical protein